MQCPAVWATVFVFLPVCSRPSSNRLSRPRPSRTATFPVVCFTRPSTLAEKLCHLRPGTAFVATGAAGLSRRTPPRDGSRCHPMPRHPAGPHATLGQQSSRQAPSPDRASRRPRGSRRTGGRHNKHDHGRDTRRHYDAQPTKHEDSPSPVEHYSSSSALSTALTYEHARGSRSAGRRARRKPGASVYGSVFTSPGDRLQAAVHADFVRVRRRWLVQLPAPGSDRCRESAGQFARADLWSILSGPMAIGGSGGGIVVSQTTNDEQAAGSRGVSARHDAPPG